MPKIETLTYTNERGESVEFSHRSVYHTDDVSGLSDMRNAIYSYNSMGQDGETYLSGRIEARGIEIIGNIKERDKDAALDLRRSLTRVLNPKSLFSTSLRGISRDDFLTGKEWKSAVC
jgi:hypothetical protein